MLEWQSMDFAPKDGAFLRLRVAGTGLMVIGRWDNGWIDEDGERFEANAWMDAKLSDAAP